MVQVVLHFVRETMVIGKGAASGDVLRWDFSVMSAESYGRNLSDNVKRSLGGERRTGELKRRQAEIATRIEQHQQGDDTVRTTLESLISLASRAADLFGRSNIDEKRQRLAFVFSNLKLRGRTLEFSTRSPFDLMIGHEGYPSWLAILDTVRKERYGHVLAFGPDLLRIASTA